MFSLVSNRNIAKKWTNNKDVKNPQEKAIFALKATYLAQKA